MDSPFVNNFKMLLKRHWNSTVIKYKVVAKVVTLAEIAISSTVFMLSEKNNCSVLRHLACTYVATATHSKYVRTKLTSVFKLICILLTALSICPYMVQAVMK